MVKSPVSRLAALSQLQVTPFASNVKFGLFSVFEEFAFSTSLLLNVAVIVKKQRTLKKVILLIIVW